MSAAAAPASGGATFTRMVSSIVQPTVTVHNSDEKLPAINEKQIVPAESTDLQPNRAIYVRNRRATIESVDFPLVYWRYDGESVIKHRSFNVDAHLFRVDIATRSGGGRADADYRHNPAYASDDDEDPPAPSVPDSLAPPPSAHATAAADTAAASTVASASTTAAAPAASAGTAAAADSKSSAAASEDPLSSATKGAKNALINGFMMRTPKYIVKSITGKTQSIDAKHPQSVHIENSGDSTFTLLHKVNSLTMHKCHSVHVTLPAVISTIELIGCSATVLTITESLDTITLDGGCKDIEIVITPALRERVKLVVTHDCVGIKVTVRESQDDAATVVPVSPASGGAAAATTAADSKVVAFPTSGGVTYAVQFPVAATAAATAAGAESGKANEKEAHSDASPVQYVTRWHDPVAEAAAVAKQSKSAAAAAAAASTASGATLATPTITGVTSTSPTAAGPSTSPAVAGAAGWITEKLQRRGIGLITNL